MGPEEIEGVKARFIRELEDWAGANVIGPDWEAAAGAPAEETIVAYVESLGYRVTGVETDGDHVTVYYGAPGNAVPETLGSGDE